MRISAELGRLVAWFTVRYPGRARASDALLLAGVGAVLRLACVAWASGRFPPAADGKFYDVVARRIADGQGYTWLWPDGAVTFAAHYPVGYPAAVGVLYAIFGPNPLWAMVFNAALGSLAVVASYWVAAHVLPRAGALLAGVMAALHPSLVLYTPALMTEGVTAALYALAAWLALLGSRTTRGHLLVLLGVLLGLTVLVRPQTLLLVPFFGAAAAYDDLRVSRHRFRHTWWCRSLVVTSLAVAVCLPWTLRNCEKMERCVLVSANGGWNLLIGTAQQGNGAWIALDQMGVPVECREVFEEAAKDACFRDAAVRRIVEDPLAWLRLVPKKWGATFDAPAAPAHYFRMSNENLFSQARERQMAAFEMLWQRGLLMLALFGFQWLPGPRRRWRAGLALVGVLSLLTPWAWPAVLALVSSALALGRSLLQYRALALGILVFGATALIHAAFFGAGRYSLVCGYLAGVLAAAFLFPHARSRPRLAASAERFECHFDSRPGTERY